VNRRRSRCTASVLGATDTNRPLPGGPKVVELTQQDPDLAAVGRTTPVRGASIMVSRIEEFLLSIPPSGPAVVLGLIDAPVAVKRPRHDLVPG
jgi:hypothetical protein